MSCTQTRVLIVGGGAAGMSAAYALSRHPDRFIVKLYERSSHPGGMATSSPIDKGKFGAEFINDGVQGASPVFYNTYRMFEELGFEASPVELQVSFGKEEAEFWTNVFPSKAIDRFKDDIQRFGKALKVIKRLEPLYAMVPVRNMLKIFGFSKEFGEVIVYPLVALFFGTGNQTPFISSAILERVFMDPNMRLFEYSSDSFLASVPEMRAFPRLSALYYKWKKHIETLSGGAVEIVTNREVTRVERVKPSWCSFLSSGTKKGSVKVWSRPTQGTDIEQNVIEPGEEIDEVFDEIVFCTDADSALKILGSDATWGEKNILGNVKYLWDITVTHNDLEYMEKFYRVKFHPSLQSQDQRDDANAQNKFEYATKNFRPLYFIRSYPGDKEKVEMSFDLTVYQPQFGGAAPDVEGGHAESTERIPLEDHVFQTIFLDKSQESSRLWSKDEINPDKIILQKWWKQQSHRWQHYAGTVPWMGLINGKNHTYFSGAWTVLNMHEIAVVSGFAAAYRLGAEYPFQDYPECKRLFTLCLAANHMARLRTEDREGLLS